MNEHRYFDFMHGLADDGDSVLAATEGLLHSLEEMYMDRLDNVPMTIEQLAQVRETCSMLCQSFC